MSSADRLPNSGRTTPALQRLTFANAGHVICTSLWPKLTMRWTSQPLSILYLGKKFLKRRMTNGPSHRNAPHVGPGLIGFPVGVTRHPHTEAGVCRVGSRRGARQK